MSAAGLFVPAACGWAAGPKMAWSKGFKVDTSGSGIQMLHALAGCGLWYSRAELPREF